MKVTLYHKPTCSTCQKVLKAIKEKGADITAIEYLKTPPTVSELDSLLKKLKLEPEGLVRKKEPLYKERYADKTLTRAEWLKVLHDNPVLIERPVVVMGDKAIIARPPETLERLFS